MDPSNTIATLAFSADTAANGASNADFVTRTAAQTISGTLSSPIAAGEGVYVSLNNGSTWAAATASGTGWSLAGVTLTGSGTLQIRVTDTAGNNGVALSQAYVLDTTAPTTTIATLGFSADTAANGGSNSDLITSTAAQTISGTLSANLLAGETVYVSLDNGSTWAAATATTGQSTWSLAGVTLSGSDTLVVKVSDAAGNDGTALTHDYALDTTSPTTSITTASFSADTAANGTSNSDFNTRTAAQTISGTLSANLLNGETVYVSVNNGANWLAAATTVGANAWSLSGVNLTASSTLLVKVTDTAGNQGGVLSQAYVYDTTPPTNSIATATFSADTAANGTTNNDFVTKTAGQTIQGTLASNLAVGETVYVSLDNGAHWTAASSSTNTWSLAGQTIAGSDTLKVKVTDLAGNDSATVFSHAYTLDTTAPTTTIATASFSANSGTNGDILTNTAIQTISGTLGGSIGGDETVFVSLNGGISWTAATMTSGTAWSLASQTVTASNLLEVKVVDAAGNDGPLFTHSYTFDNTNPAAPTLALLTDTGNSSDGITSLATVNVNGVESNASWQYQIDGGSWTTGTGTSFNLINGTHSYAVQQTDQAGNLGNASSSTSYTLDTAAPTASISDNVAGTASGAVTFTFNFNEAVVGFDASDITVTNGTKGTLSGSGGTYTMSITPAAGSGNMTVGLNTGGFSDVAGNVNSVATASDVQAYQGLLGQSVIDLATVPTLVGASKLIAPVQVGGNWYYFWDISGGGTADATDVWTNHNVLDSIFSQNSNGTAINGDTSDTQRYATISGIRLALPTLSELSAIYASSGLPTGWQNDAYWSASLSSADYHQTIGFNNGGATSSDYDFWDNYLEVYPSYFVALQVIGYAGPTAPTIALATDSGSNTTDGITNIATVNVGALVANTTWQYQVDGGAWINGSGSSFNLSSGTHTYAAHQTDQSGNVGFVSATSTYTLDTTAPTVTITDTTGGTVNSGYAHFTFNFSEAVVGFTAADITVTNGALGTLTGSGSSYAMDITPVMGSGNMTVGISTGSFTDVAGNANSVATTPVVQPYNMLSQAGQAVIDLGANGKLISPLQIEGKWYYYWDRNGDGTFSLADVATHDVLDGIFNHDINGVTNTTVLNADGQHGTTDTYRYGSINGVGLALPTLGATYAGSMFMPGTSASGTGTADNPTYNDLLAIWDALNGTGVGTNSGSNMNATLPATWGNSSYWSATPTSAGHAYAGLSNGVVNSTTDDGNTYLVLQVL